ncbi:MAG: hypothetical protein WCI88_04845 [Chloroflexota bacterium]
MMNFSKPICMLFLLVGLFSLTSLWQTSHAMQRNEINNRVSSYADYGKGHLPQKQTIPTDTPTPVLERPLLVIKDYRIDKVNPKPLEQFTLFMTLENVGVLDADYIQVVFPAEKFYPLVNGGVPVIEQIPVGGKKKVRQMMQVSPNTVGINTMAIQIRYIGSDGASYSDTFTLKIDTGWYYWTLTPTPSPTSQDLPQLIIESYAAEPAILEPGTIFNLSVRIRNIGLGSASNVLMVFGGASRSDQGMTSSDESLKIFSLVNSSNVKPVADMRSGDMATIVQPFIVNTNTRTGAQNLPISFMYTTEQKTKMVDNQIISLQVFVKPKIAISFYEPFTPGVNRPVKIPLMITNIGSNTVQLGKISLQGVNWEIDSVSEFVGKLESGDVWQTAREIMGTPKSIGDFPIKISVHYTDDFGQPQQLEETIPVTIMEDVPIVNTPAGVAPPGNVNELTQEDFWSVPLRFIMGVLGLGSGKNNSPDVIPTSQSSDQPGIPLEMPTFVPK